MEFEVSYELENEQQFWDELDDILSSDAKDHEAIDNTLRSYLSFTAKFKEEYLQTDYEIVHCSYQLSRSETFQENKDYVRRQLVYALLQEEDVPTIHIIAAFLLFDGRSNEEPLQMMQKEDVFPRLVELIQQEEAKADASLHRALLDLLYEMSRIQRLTWEDLSSIHDSFVLFLFEVIENLADDVNDPHLYPIIRVLLALNEQYMVSQTHASDATNNTTPLTNRVLKALSTHGPSYKNFGRTLILLLNRESETSLQLLILKLLYLLFQSPSTAEYFYTNDLYVLLDLIIRNLLDLPTDSPPATALRHTYLRVLHPMLVHSQLAKPPHYKREEVLKMLRLLAQSGTHFAPVDETTMRLVKRCNSVAWLQVADAQSPVTPSGVESMTGSIVLTPVSPDEPSSSPEKGAGQKELAKRLLGMNLKDETAAESSLSVAEVADHMAKPGDITPSLERNGQYL